MCDRIAHEVACQLGNSTGIAQDQIGYRDPRVDDSARMGRADFRQNLIENRFQAFLARIKREPSAQAAAREVHDVVDQPCIRCTLFCIMPPISAACSGVFAFRKSRTAEESAASGLRKS